MQTAQEVCLDMQKRQTFLNIRNMVLDCRKTLFRVFESTILPPKNSHPCGFFLPLQFFGVHDTPDKNAAVHLLACHSIPP
jgi:hypothetical protein